VTGEPPKLASSGFDPHGSCRGKRQALPLKSCARRVALDCFIPSNPSRADSSVWESAGFASRRLRFDSGSVHLVT
jgi:hypothetical protein